MPLKLLVHSSFLLSSMICFAQETGVKTQKLSFELGGGFCYSSLKDFNKKLITGAYFSEGLHVGYCLESAIKYHWNRALTTSFILQPSIYSISEYKSDLKFEDPMPGGVNYQYDLALKSSLRSIDLAVNTTLYLDRIKRESNSTKLNYGIYVTAIYGFGRYHEDRTIYIWGDGDGHLDRERHNYAFFNIQYGLVAKLNFEHAFFQSLIFRAGILHTLHSAFDTQPSNNTEVTLDFTGFKSCLTLQFGFDK